MARTSTPRVQLRRFGFIGSFAGAVLLSTFVLLSGWYERQINAHDGMGWNEGVSLFPVLHGLWTGAIIGALVGVSSWAVFTRRPVHPLLTIAGSVINSVVAATLLHLLQSIVAASQKNSASGQMALAFDFMETYLFLVLPGSVIFGIICGFLCTKFRRSHAGSN